MKCNTVIQMLVVLISYISTAQSGNDVSEVSEFMPYQIMSFLTTTLGASDDPGNSTRHITKKTSTLIPYRDGNLWGYANANAQIKIPLQYQYASRFYNNIAYVKKGQDYFFINEKGEKLSNINWIDTGEKTTFESNSGYLTDSKSYILKHSNTNQYKNSWFDGSRLSNQGLLKVYNKNERVGVIDIYGKIVVPTRYDDISFLNEGMIVTKLDNALGVYTKEGKEVIPPRYDIIYDFNDGMARVKKIEYEGMISSTGEEIISFRSKFRQVTKEGNYIRVIDTKDRQGLYDLQGKLIVPVSYTSINLINDYFFIGKKEKTSGYVLIATTTLKPYSAEYLSIRDNRDKILIVENKNRDKVILDVRTGNPIHKGSYTQCTWHSTTRTFQVYKEGKQGILDSIGNEIIPMGVYNDIDQLENGYIKVHKEGSGLADSTGKLIIPTQYVDFRVLKKNGLIAVFNKARKWGIFDMKGNQLVDFIYNDVRARTGSDYPIVQKDERYGMIDNQGNLLVACLYKSIKVRDNYLVVRNAEGKYGTTDKHGKSLIPVLYDRCFGFKGYDIIVNEFQEQILITNEGHLAASAFYDRIEKVVLIEVDKKTNQALAPFFMVTKDGLKGIISHHGKIKIPPKYYKIYYQVGDLFLVDYTGEGEVYGYVDTKGREYFKN